MANPAPAEIPLRRHDGRYYKRKMKNILAVEVSEYSRWATLNLLGDEDDDELERDPVIYLKSRAPFVIQAFVGLIVEIVLDFLAVRVMLPSLAWLQQFDPVLNNQSKQLSFLLLIFGAEVYIRFFCDLALPCMQLLSFLLRACLCAYCWASVFHLVRSVVRFRLPTASEAFLTIAMLLSPENLWLFVAGFGFLLWRVAKLAIKSLFLPIKLALSSYRSVRNAFDRWLQEYNLYISGLPPAQKNYLDALLRPFSTRLSKLGTLLVCFSVGLFVPWEGLTSIPRELIEYVRGERQLFCVVCCIRDVIAYVTK